MVRAEVDRVEIKQLAEASVHAVEMGERKVSLGGTGLIGDDDALVSELAQPADRFQRALRRSELVGMERGVENPQLGIAQNLHQDAVPVEKSSTPWPLGRSGGHCLPLPWRFDHRREIGLLGRG